VGSLAPQTLLTSSQYFIFSHPQVQRTMKPSIFPTKIPNFPIASFFPKRQKIDGATFGYFHFQSHSLREGKKSNRYFCSDWTGRRSWWLCTGPDDG
jgi:hypothetical protein